MLETLSTAGPFPSIEKLDHIARKTRLIMRSSNRFSAHGFLLTLIQTVLKGDNSLNHIAIGLAQHQTHTMTRQAMHQRLDGTSSAFLIHTLYHLIKVRTRSIIPRPNKTPFKRILIEDTTVLPMHKSNHATFPGNGNGRNTAGAKIHLLADWLSGDILECALHTARSADQGLSGEVLGHCRAGDLILRDMGFFHLETLAQIERRKAFWLSRLPASVTAYNRSGNELDTILRRAQKTNRRQIELTVHLGQHREKKCRLIATRLSKQQTEKNRRQRRRDARRHGATPSRRGLLRDGWSILVTNLTKHQIPAATLHKLYSLRWNIEIQFRGIKQSCRFEKTLNHKSNQHHMEALILAAMIYQIITLKLHATIRRNLTKKQKRDHPGISYEKLCDAAAQLIAKLTKDKMNAPFEFDPRHISHDKRTRQTLYTTSLHSLT